MNSPPTPQNNGALSQPGGRLEVSWGLVPDGTGDILWVTWKEKGGPPVHEPTRRGFGSRLVEQSMRALGGTAEIEYASGGLCCEIRVPLESTPLDLVVPNGVNVHLSTRSPREQDSPV
jgi:two-component sensor histidine kinase